MPLKPIEIRQAAKALADCPGWTDLVRPEIDRHLHQLEDDVLNGDFDTKALEDKRAAYAALKKLLRDLSGYVLGSLNTLTPDEVALFPRSVRTQMEDLFSPPLRGVQQPVAAPENPLAKVDFPPAHQFNPFAAKFTPEPLAQPSPTADNGQPPPPTSS